MAIRHPKEELARTAFWGFLGAVIGGVVGYQLVQQLGLPEYYGLACIGIGGVIAGLFGR